MSRQRSPASPGASRAAALVGVAGVFSSGILLALADAPVHAAPLQLVAFLPFLVVVGRSERGGRAAFAGAMLGAVRASPFAAAVAALPPAAWVAVPAYVILLHAAFGAACFASRRAPAPVRAFAPAMAYVALELADAHLPMWGTALSLACAWAPYPWAIGFISVTGPSGVAAAVVGAQGLVLSVWGCGRRTRIAALAALGLLCAAASIVVARRAPAPALPALGAPAPALPARGPLRVAVVGWPAGGGPSAPEGPARFEGLVREAAARGARLIVSPEAAFVVRSGERDALLRDLGALARANRVHLAVGYIDRARDDNRVVFVAPDGSATAEYVKTHLVPLAETTHAGDGAIALVEVDGVKVGAMICQDDNFTDLAAAYARAGAQLVVSPTFEMSPRLGALHLRNALLRPTQYGFAYARAAANGTSAIVSSAGLVVASYDHAARGAAAVVADVP